MGLTAQSRSPGTVAHWGTVAVDPGVIPLGSRLRIDGFDDTFIAEDTGGGVRGDHVEIFFFDTASALQFGVQHRMVTVLPDPNVCFGALRPGTPVRKPMRGGRGRTVRNAYKSMDEGSRALLRSVGPI